MKSFRPLIIGLPLLLAECLALSGLSWSSFSPFHWFGESRKVSEQGVGDITAAAMPMTQPTLEKALGAITDGDAVWKPAPSILSAFTRRLLTR